MKSQCKNRFKRDSNAVRILNFNNQTRRLKAGVLCCFFSMFKNLIIIFLLLISCNSGIDQNYELEKEVIEDTYQELFPWLKQLPATNSINPQYLTVKDSLDYPFLYGQSKAFLESNSNLDEVFFGVIMWDSVRNTNFFLKESPYLSDLESYPDLLISDSVWSDLVKDFSSGELKTVNLNKLKLNNLDNLKIFKQSNFAKDRSIIKDYAILAWYLRFSRVSFSPDKTKAVFYAEDYETHGGLVFAELVDGKWKVIHYEINWVG